MNGTAKERLIALALAKMPPTSLRLALLEMAGMSTNEALDMLGTPKSNRYRVITALRRSGIKEPRPIREAVLAQRSSAPSKKVTTADGHCSCKWGARRTSALVKTCWHVGAVLLDLHPRRAASRSLFVLSA